MSEARFKEGQKIEACGMDGVRVCGTIESVYYSEGDGLVEGWWYGLDNGHVSEGTVIGIALPTQLDRIENMLIELQKRIPTWEGIDDGPGSVGHVHVPPSNVVE